MSRSNTCAPLCAFLVTLGLGAVAHAQDADGSLCAAAIRDLKQAPAATLQIASGRLTAVELSPEGSAGSSRYVEREVRVERSGRRTEFRNVYICSEGKLALESHQSLDPTEPSEAFEPALPVLAFPITGTSSWSYSGVYIMDIAGEKTRLPASGSGYLTGRPSADHQSAYQAHWQVSFGRSERRTITSDTWYVPASLAIVARRLSDSDGGSFEGTGDVPSVTAPAGTPNEDQKKIIIIIDPQQIQ